MIPLSPSGAFRAYFYCLFARMSYRNIGTGIVYLACGDLCAAAAESLS